MVAGTTNYKDNKAMCIVFGKEKPELLIAEEDIVCYKVIEEYKNKREKGAPSILRAMYFPKHVYQFDTLFEVDEMCVQDITIESDLFRLSPHWEGTEGFHSYVNIEDTQNCYLGVIETHWDISTSLIVRCIIPKGTQYYKGLDNGIAEKYAYLSKAIKIVEVCEA